MHVVEVGSSEELEELVSETFAPVMFAGARPHFRRGRLAVQELGGGISLMDAHSDPFRASPTVRMRATATSEDVLLFGVHTAGEARVRQYGRVADVTPGSGVLYEARGEFELAFPTDMRSLTLAFPRELLPVRSSEITERCARSLRSDLPSMRLLSGYIGQLCALAEGFSARQRDDAGRVAIALLALALRDLNPGLPEETGAAEVVLGMMRDHVCEHLTDSLLTVEELARRHHVSVRHMYALFARLDTTPGAFIREQRLQAARAMLSDPKHATRAVSSIAAAVGFTELRTFQRSFHREYGMSPGQWRREHRDAETGARRR